MLIQGCISSGLELPLRPQKLVLCPEIVWSFQCAVTTLVVRPSNNSLIKVC